MVVLLEDRETSTKASSNDVGEAVAMFPALTTDDAATATGKAATAASLVEIDSVVVEATELGL